MAWNHEYRRLDEGEIIRATDEVMLDTKPITWKADGGQCAGKKAPSPLYTSHRVYRRLKGEADGT